MKCDSLSAGGVPYEGCVFFVLFPYIFRHFPFLISIHGTEADTKFTRRKLLRMGKKMGRGICSGNENAYATGNMYVRVVSDWASVLEGRDVCKTDVPGKGTPLPPPEKQTGHTRDQCTLTTLGRYALACHHHVKLFLTSDNDNV